MDVTPPILRQSLDLLLLGEENPPFTRRRQVMPLEVTVAARLVASRIDLCNPSEFWAKCGCKAQFRTASIVF